MPVSYHIYYPISRMIPNHMILLESMIQICPTYALMNTLESAESHQGTFKAPRALLLQLYVINSHGWLVCKLLLAWFTAWVAGRLAGRLVGCVVGWWVGRLPWLVGRLPGWLVGPLVGRLAGWVPG